MSAARIAIALICLQPIGVLAQTPVKLEGFICAPMAAIGFSYDAARKRWAPEGPEPPDVRYLIIRRSDGWEFQQLGKPQPEPLACEPDFDAKTDTITCEAADVVRMSRKELRFVKVNWSLKYLFGIDTADSPLVEIGRCSPL